MERDYTEGQVLNRDLLVRHTGKAGLQGSKDNQLLEETALPPPYPTLPVVLPPATIFFPIHQVLINLEFILL